MGGQVDYLLVPRFPGDMNDNVNQGKGKKWILGHCIAIPWVLFFTFLGLYLSVMFSDPAIKLEQCQSELQNQTSTAKAAFTSLQERMEDVAKKETVARTESHGLWTQLLATNQSLLEAKQHWESCQNQLKTLEQKLTSQVAEAAQHEMKKCQANTTKLQQELSSKTQDLEDAQHQNQQQREECDARIQEIRAQHTRISTSTCSNAWVLGGPMAALLALTVPGFLLLLLLL